MMTMLHKVFYVVRHLTKDNDGTDDGADQRNDVRFRDIVEQDFGVLKCQHEGDEAEQGGLRHLPVSVLVEHVEFGILHGFFFSHGHRKKMLADLSSIVTTSEDVLRVIRSVQVDDAQLLAVNSSQSSDRTIIEETSAPPTRRREWTSIEDELIMKQHQRLGSKWRVIARCLPHRSEDSVRNRLVRLYQAQYPHKQSPRPKRARGSWAPRLKDGNRTRHYWTPREDAIVVSFVREHGQKWNELQKLLKPRTSHAIRNRLVRILNTNQPDAVTTDLPKIN